LATIRIPSNARAWQSYRTYSASIWFPTRAAEKGCTAIVDKVEW